MVESGKFEKLSVPSLKEAFIQQMLRKMICGELKPGDHLPSERDLAKQMGISRASVNHGILELETMGFLIVNPRHGTIVADYMKHQTPQTISALMNYGSIELNHPLFRDLMETRILLEKEAAKLACSNAYEKTLNEMQQELNVMAKDPVHAIEEQYLFHYHLMQASGNSVYAMIYRGFEVMIKALIRRHYQINPADGKTAVLLHEKLLAQLRDHNASEAPSTVEEIIRRGERALETQYQQIAGES